MAEKILVIDDNHVICMLIESRLKANGYDVIIALSGEDGLAKARAEKPDLILLDITMPGMDGFEVAAQLKDSEETNNIPFVMLTARGEQEAIAKALNDLGAKGYVVKPFKPDVLLGEIQRTLKGEAKT
ncbi:MAG: response regulator [Candidatus Omnitrophota bacterium]